MIDSDQEKFVVVIEFAQVSNISLYDWIAHLWTSSLQIRFSHLQFLELKTDYYKFIIHQQVYRKCIGSDDMFKSTPRLNTKESN